MDIETIAPQYNVGDAVELGHRRGTITRIYDNALVPLWYGGRRIVHTHCYELRMEDTGRPFWGAVDAELSKP